MRATQCVVSILDNNIEVHRRSTMTTCTVTPTLAAPLATRILDALLRYFSRSVVTRESIDQAWLESGLGRLSRDTLEDIGASPQLIARAEQREASMEARRRARRDAPPLISERHGRPPAWSIRARKREVVLGGLLWPLDHRRVADVGHDDGLRVGQQRLQDGHRADRQRAVLVAPDDQGRRGQALASRR